MKRGKLIRRVFALTTSLDPWYMPVMFFTKVLSSAPKYITYIFMSYLIDSVMQHVSIDQIMKTSLIYLSVIAVSELTHWGVEKFVVIHERRLRNIMDQKILDKAFEIDFEQLERKETLDLIHKAREGANANGDVVAFCRLTGRFVVDLSDITFSIIILSQLFRRTAGSGSGMLFALMSSNWSMLIIPVCLACSIFMTTRLQKKANAIQLRMFNDNIDSNRKYAYFERLIETQSIGQDIRIYGMAGLLNRRVSQYLAISRRNSLRGTRDQNRLFIFSNASSFLFQIICNLYIGLMALFGMITTGNFIKYVNTMISLGLAIAHIFDNYLQIDMVCSYLVYYTDFLDLENRKHEGTLPTEVRSTEEGTTPFEIEFRDVCFRYPSSTDYVLEHVNITLHSGEKLAFVGQNGAGKTTFVKLLCRLYDPTAGEILLNGRNIREYDYAQYMNLFSVVFQDFQLMSSSIAENVATGTSFDRDAVRQVLERAGMGERLSRLEAGMDTPVYQLEKNGVEISGGEAQKIAIARALYKNAPFVIMDEPTSALDPISEYDIYNRFNDLVQDKAAIYISHRMSSCRFCDTIYVFQDGTITQSGSHEQLIADTDGLYYRMWTAQAQYYQDNHPSTDCPKS